VPRSLIKNRFVYLCVFDVTGWFPVAWAERRHGRAVFSDLGVNSVYQLASFDGDSVCAAGYPFLLDTLGQIKPFLPDHANPYDKLTLHRKQDIAFWLLDCPSQLTGSMFQGANRPDFSDAETLHVMNMPDFRFTAVEVYPSRAYRYYRYLFSDTAQANMAEVEFIEKGTGRKLSGKIMSDYQPSDLHPDFSPERMFDGDALTYFHASDRASGWSGISLDYPVRIESLRYLIRNDDNGIRKGEEYELLYAADGCWKSVERKIATADDSIVFKKVPRTLHNIQVPVLSGLQALLRSRSTNCLG
jgi:hypothetical protein